MLNKSFFAFLKNDLFRNWSDISVFVLKLLHSLQRKNLVIISHISKAKFVDN